MSRDYYDQLIDQLLRETLGGDRPRDMTTRVMALAKGHDRTRRSWWFSAGAAIAAGVAVALTLWAVWPRRNADTFAGAPDYVANNLYVFGDQIGPGVRAATADDSPGTLKIAGRDSAVEMDVAPSSSFTLGSGPRGQERVFLEDGHVDVSTRKGVFQLLVGPATVKASNTTFGVDVKDSFDETEQKFLKRLVVKVLDGSADISGVDNPVILRAGDSKTFTISEEVQPHLVQPAHPPTQSPDGAPVSPNRPGRGLRGRVAPNGDLPGTAQIQIIIGPGPYALDGILRHYGAYLFLQTDHGNFMLGTLENFDDRPPAPGPQSYVHVVFGKGRVTRIESIKSIPSPTLQLPAQPVPTVSTQIHL